ncbi:MAG: acyltransferase domain-containing protein [Gemmatimonadetes bacterium]|nr:acyltransferase domain-containing protein [Gemmatimonadota bacterium]
MGSDLFDAFPGWVRRASEVLGYSIEELCRSTPERLRDTENAQVAVYVVNALAYRAWHERWGERPNFLLGHSVGELNALLAADVFDFETGLRIVRHRGRQMGSAEAAGGMTAVLGDRARVLRHTERFGRGVTIAADNSPGQVVVSGSEAALAAFHEHVAREDLGTAIPLAVSGPFHSPHMETARVAFLDYLRTVPLASPKLPVIANVTATEYRDEDMIDVMTDVLARPVRWVDSVRYVTRRGPMLFTELGDAHVVSPLIQDIVTASPDSVTPLSNLTTRRVSP